MVRFTHLCVLALLAPFVVIAQPGGATEAPGGGMGGASEAPGGNMGGATEAPGGNMGGGMGGGMGGATEAPGGNMGGATEAPGGGGMDGNTTKPDPIMMNATSETMGPTDSTAETPSPAPKGTTPPAPDNTTGTETDAPAAGPDTPQGEPTVSPSADINEEDLSVDEFIFQDSDLSTLAVALNASGIVIGSSCIDDCNFTVFAPSDEAFDQIDGDFLAKLLEPAWILHLQNLLAYHVVSPTADRVLSSDLMDGMELTMLNAENTTLGVDRDVTVLSPYSDAVATVIDADNEVTNGNVHVIDTILTPYFLVTDLLALAGAVEGFSILVELLEASDLAPLIPANQDFTILAPNDAAFEKLGNETIEALKANTTLLIPIITNHVLVGVYPSVILSDGATVTSVGGLNVTVSISGDTIMLNEATVIAKDTLALNGIVHGIDTVLGLDTTSGTPAPGETPAPAGIPSPGETPAPVDTPTEAPVTGSGGTTPPPVLASTPAPGPTSSVANRLSMAGAILAVAVLVMM